MSLRPLALAAVFACALGSAARAEICAGAPPADTEQFRGPVLEVLDGERLCVALGPDPSSWVPVRLADTLLKASTTPPSRGALMAASFGQDVTCRITGRDEYGLLAVCSGDRGSVGQLAQAPGVVKAGLDWR